MAASESQAWFRRVRGSRVIAEGGIEDEEESRDGEKTSEIGGRKGPAGYKSSEKVNRTVMHDV